MRRLGALPALAALAVALFAHVGSSDAEVASEGCPPSAASSSSAGVAPAPATPAAAAGAEPAPGQTLACVGAEAIAGATYSHWLTVAKKGTEPSPKQRHPLSEAELREQTLSLRKEVLGFLISSDWVEGEAKDLGVGVSAAEVRKEFDHIRGAQFHKRREFEAFLRESGQTVADLLYRVELNMLSERIQKHVVAGRRSASSKQRALSRFVKAFKGKWEAQTYCASEYDVADCGHVQGSV